MPVRLMVGFALAAFAALLIAVLTYRSNDERAKAVDNLNATVERITQIQMVWSHLKDAESAKRGYLLSGQEQTLGLFTVAQAAVPVALEKLRGMTRGSLLEQQRFDQLQGLATKRMTELAHIVALQREGRREEALEAMRGDGQATMETTRTLVREMLNTEQQQLQAQREVWEGAFAISAYLTWGSAAVLLLLTCASAVMTMAEYRSREVENWIKGNLVGLGTRLQGEQRIHDMAGAVIGYLATELDARVGAIYVTQGHGIFERMGGYALAPDTGPGAVRAGEGLLGQALQSRTLQHVRHVPSGYLPVTSGTGQATPAELVMMPIVLNGVALAVVEMGWFRAVAPHEVDFLVRAGEQLAQAVRGALDRSRLESLLDETQRQAEELQAQQEELRVNNEELEQQSRMLQESQNLMQAQQAELEHSNAQLEAQTEQLQYQKQRLLTAQDALEAKARDLAQASQYKSEFLANMSHELRTPLNSSLILAKLLADNKQQNLTAEQVRYAQTIHNAGTDLLNLINDILDLSKIEAGQTSVEIGPVTVAKVVAGVMEPLRAQAQDKGLQFNAVVEPGVPAFITSDAQRLAQILKNLLSNALKFTARGEVTMRVFAGDNDTLCFAVRDTGIGIAPDQQERIFDAFHQADGSTHRKYGGTGLGLSISRDLAQLLGGSIAVQSAPGEGSVFTLTLPVTAPLVGDPGERPAKLPVAPALATRAAEPPHASQPEAPAAKPCAPVHVLPDDREQLEQGRYTILVIEDDPRFARILCDLAHEMGFQCVIASTGSDGLAAALEYGPSAVVLDMNLPDFSGLGVLDQLKRNPATRHIPVHVVSVADYMQEAMERGAIGYALKPVKREELEQALRHMQAKFTQSMRRVLVVEDDARQRESVRHLLATDGVEIVGAATARQALDLLKGSTFDCMVMDLHLPDLNGYELLQQMAEQEEVSFPPVIVYTGRNLSRDEEQQLRRFSKSIIIKDARSPERLLDEVTLFLHQVESTLPDDRRRMLQLARDRESTFEGRTILVVEDDVRNVFALSSVLEPTGARVEIARNGREALEALERSNAAGESAVDLVLMDIMMPEMDGFAAMAEIRRRPEWRRLPIIALTAKAMKDDQEKCLAAGANDYIAKPLDVEKLLSLMRVWMPK
ncbi:response regulator [Diaphorobacter sp. JS3050]|uniref:response regulator n=1 Tax=Diaphorobacter sp. JS3050 TaxID=2735554 RepID=UPI001554DF34|nr:response regulator [Diaphorobacter sp. JS3050]QJY32321.1 response regulator [Diaphorobacter sp. JS3050]